MHRIEDSKHLKSTFQETQAMNRKTVMDFSAQADATGKRVNEALSLLNTHETRLIRIMDEMKGYDRKFAQMKKDVKEYEGLVKDFASDTEVQIKRDKMEINKQIDEMRLDLDHVRFTDDHLKFRVDQHGKLFTEIES